MTVRNIGTAIAIPDIGTVGSPERIMGQGVEDFLDTLDTFLSTAKTNIDTEFANVVQPSAVNYVYNSNFQKHGGLACYNSTQAIAYFDDTLLQTEHPAGWNFTIDNLYSQFKTSKGVCTISIASPGVVSLTGHGLATGQAVKFETTGALPTGLNTTDFFFVIYVGTGTFRLATTLANATAGTAINTSGTQSGVHTCFIPPAGTETLNFLTGEGIRINYTGTTTKVEVYQAVNEGYANLEHFAGKNFVLDVELKTDNPETYIDIGANPYNSGNYSGLAYPTKVEVLGARTRLKHEFTFLPTFNTHGGDKYTVYAGVYIDNLTQKQNGIIEIYSVKLYPAEELQDSVKEIMDIDVGQITNSSGNRKTEVITDLRNGTYPLVTETSHLLLKTKFRRLFSAIGDISTVTDNSSFNFPATYFSSGPSTNWSFGYLRNKSAITLIGAYQNQAMQAHKHTEPGHLHRTVGSTSTIGSNASIAAGTATLQNTVIALGSPSASTYGTPGYDTNLIEGEHFNVIGVIRI